MKATPTPMPGIRLLRPVVHRDSRGAFAELWGQIRGQVHFLLCSRPRQWRAHVNRPQSDAELAALHRCVARGTPYGSDDRVARTARRLGLESTLRPRGRPPKQKK
jgi:hypothetical protein